MNRRVRILVLVGPLALGLALRPAAAQQLFNPTGWYTVANAAAANKLVDVQSLLVRGDNPNHVDGEGRTALTYAATNGNADMAKLLLDKGAHADFRDRIGNTPLHWAAEAGHVEVMRQLLAAKAPVDAQNRQGITPLMLAASRAKTEAVRLLLASGADPGKQDFTGRDSVGYASPSNASLQRMLREAKPR